MEERATGIILRTRPLTETSLIVNWLTAEHGRIATVAKGARRPKSPFRGKLDLFYAADFSFVRSRRSDLHALREVHLSELHTGLREDFGRLQQASYASALIEQTTETDTPLSGAFELLSRFLQHIVTHPPAAESVFTFEMKLLRELGQEPDLAEAKLTDGTKQILTRFTYDDWGKLRRLKSSAPQLREIQQFLHGFLIYHLGKIPSGRAEVMH